MAPQKRFTDEQLKARRKRWEQENREHCLEWRRQYYAKNREAKNIRQRELYQINRERHCAQEAEYRKKPVNRIKMLIGNARVRARKSGREFELAAFSVFLASPPSHCGCCGKEISYALGNGPGHRNNPHAPSLDRKDNRIGYVRGNVFLICFRCNWVKNDATVDELLTVAEYMAGNLNRDVG